MDEDDANSMRLNRLFNTFSSPLLRQYEAREVDVLDIVNLEGNDGNHGYNEHFRDFSKYKKMWMAVCNRIVLSKTESIIDAMEEKAKVFGWRHTENVARMMQL